LSRLGISDSSEITVSVSGDKLYKGLESANVEIADFSGFYDGLTLQNIIDNETVIYTTA
jgi:hypothetical protein